MSSPDCSRWVANEWRSTPGHFLLHRGLGQRVAPQRTSARVGRAQRAGKHPLPAPAAGRVAVLQRQRVGQPHRAEAGGQVRLVQRAGVGQLLLQRLHQVLRQHSDPIFAALAVAHQEFAASELDVLDPQAQALQQPHAGTVQQRGDQAHGAAQWLQQHAQLAGHQHQRQPPLVFGHHDLVQSGQFHPQHLAIQEQQRRLGLVPGRRRHVPVHRQ